MALVLLFKLLIHFELIFVNGVRSGLNFILLHVEISYPLPFAEESDFSPLNIFNKSQLAIYVWFYFCTFNSIPLVCLSLCQQHIILITVAL